MDYSHVIYRPRGPGGASDWWGGGGGWGERLTLCEHHICHLQRYTTYQGILLTRETWLNSQLILKTPDKDFICPRKSFVGKNRSLEISSIVFRMLFKIYNYEVSHSNQLTASKTRLETLQLRKAYFDPPSAVTLCCANKSQYSGAVEGLYRSHPGAGGQSVNIVKPSSSTTIHLITAGL